MEIAVGRPIHIPCLADGSPKPTIEWTKVGEEAAFMRSELRFTSVSQQDAGYYECRAKNGVEKDLISKIKLIVLGK